MVDSEIKLTKDVSNDFRDWVNFNLESLTWQGRYRNEFEDFWNYFFVEDISLKSLIEKFDYSCRFVKIGPLVSWFEWLKGKLICFIFIKFNVSILELSQMTDIPVTNIAFILRGFFIEKFPFLEDFFNEKFQISNIINQNVNTNIEMLKREVQLDGLDSGSLEDEVLPSMEITLYEEWIKLLGKIKKDFTEKKIKSKEVSFGDKLKKTFSIVRDVVLLLAVTTFIIWIVQFLNRQYENYLLDRISVYEPQLKWLNKNLTFKKEVLEDNQNTKVEYDIDEAAPKKLTQEEEAKVQEEVFQTESEVMVTSWDSLPRDINSATLEQSDYEEKLRTGYRDYRYGRNKVFRVLLKTTDFIESRNKLNLLSLKYQAEQVDNVKPGTLVPGGAYYNLYIPRKYLKEFLAQVMEQDQGVLYESNTRSMGNPPGKNKVFIWVKSI